MVLGWNESRTRWFLDVMFFGWHSLWVEWFLIKLFLDGMMLGRNGSWTKLCFLHGTILGWNNPCMGWCFDAASVALSTEYQT